MRPRVLLRRGWRLLTQQFDDASLEAELLFSAGRTQKLSSILRVVCFAIAIACVSSLRRADVHWRSALSKACWWLSGAACFGLALRYASRRGEAAKAMLVFEYLFCGVFLVCGSLHFLNYTWSVDAHCPRRAGSSVGQAAAEARADAGVPLRAVGGQSLLNTSCLRARVERDGRRVPPVRLWPCVGRMRSGPFLVGGFETAPENS